MHTVRNQKKLLDRLRKIKGQIEALERLIGAGKNEDMSLILQTVASTRGALNALMGELIEGHVREHILRGDDLSVEGREQAVEDVVDIVLRYLK